MVALAVSQGVPQPGARLRRYTAAEAIVPGQPVYRDPTAPYPGGVRLTDSNAGDPAKARCVGVSANAALAPGAPVDVVSEGPIDVGVAVAKGTLFVVGTTAGAINPIADLATGSYTTVVGYGKGGNILHVKIVNTEQLVP